MGNKRENEAHLTKGQGSIMGKARQMFSRRRPPAPKTDNGDRLPPYEPFIINPDVLHELHAWNSRHPSDRLPSVLDRIVQITESKPLVAALDAIPPSPFPVGPLVKSLLSLIAFGIRVPKRKKDASDFATQVVTDLNAIAQALGTAPPDDTLLIQCKADLVPFCVQVNEICSWAAEQLRGNLAASADEERDDFQEKITRTKVSFLTLSTIRIMREVSLIGQDVEKLLNSHERKANLDSLEKRFGNFVAAQYEYHQQSKDECHPFTRNAVLSMLDQWIRSTSVSEEHLVQCYWLLGIAGVGKTAIAMTTVECLLAGRPISPAHDATLFPQNEGQPVLCAQYFCNHLLDSAGIQRLFPTLAMQLAMRSPAAAHMISSTLRRDPTILHKFGPDQAETLVVVIDGVDELRPTTGDNPAFHGHVTKVIGGLTTSLPSNVRILVLSRPESKIVENIPGDLVYRYDLPTSESVEDVRRYFGTELPKLGKEVGLFSFPSEAHYDMLCETAAGHLGWAKQAVNWLYRRLEFTNGAELDQEIRDIGALARGNFDQLYRHILLRSLPPDGVDRERYAPALHAVLRCLAVLKEPQSIYTISQLVSVKNDFNILNCFKRLSSLYESGNEPVTLDTIPQPHKSFYDFLVSSHAPAELVVEAKSAHRELAVACLNIMRSALHLNMGGKQAPLFESSERLSVPLHIHYACASFGYHAASSDRQFGVALFKDLRSWVEHELFYWMEVLYLSNEVDFNPDRDSDPTNALISLWATHEDFGRRLQSAGEVARAYLALQRSNSTDLYTAILPFHPTLASPTCISLLPKPPQWIDESKVVSYVVSCDGDTVAVVHEGHLTVFSIIKGTTLWCRAVPNTDVPVLGFSPGGTLAVATLEVLDDLCTNLDIVALDALSGKERFTIKSPLDMGQLECKAIQRLLFSPQSDHLCVLFHAWNPHPYQALYTFQIYTVADGHLVLERRNINRIVGYLDDSKCALTTFNYEHEQTQTLLLDHTTCEDEHLTSLVDAAPSSVDVSRTGIEVFGGHGYIHRGEPGAKTRITTALGTKDHSITSVCFSPGDDFLALGCVGGSIQMWNTSELSWVHVATLRGHIGTIEQVVFRNDSEGKLRYLISSSEYGIRIWDVSAVVQGRDFDMPGVEEGVLADPGWFRCGIMLGGWGLNGKPFRFQYPFKLPPDIRPLDWEMAAEGSA